MANFIKDITKRLINAVVVPAARYVIKQVDEYNVIRELERRTAVECADYAQAKMPTALQFENKRDLLRYAFKKADGVGIIAEFGVWTGGTVNLIAGMAKPRLVYGFDSFEGLKEDWVGWKEPKGYFNLHGRLPAVESNVRLVKGWFDQTLPAFLSVHPDPASFIHIDSDTYESAKTIFDLIQSRIGVGTVIVFDEYFGYSGWKLGEFKAWQQLADEHSISYDYLGFSAQSVSIRVMSIRGK
jgi:Macrocin-O-methyltransferase (TylF)